MLPRCSIVVGPGYRSEERWCGLSTSLRRAVKDRRWEYQKVTQTKSWWIERKTQRNPPLCRYQNSVREDKRTQHSLLPSYLTIRREAPKPKNTPNINAKQTKHSRSIIAPHLNPSNPTNASLPSQPTSQPINFPSKLNPIEHSDKPTCISTTHPTNMPLTTHRRHLSIVIQGQQGRSRFPSSTLFT